MSPRAKDTQPVPNFQSYTAETDAASFLESKWNLIDKAARKSDRWWFLALLMIGIAFVGFLLRWCQIELNKRDTRIEALEGRYQVYLTNQNAAVVAALVNSTQAMQENTRMLQRIETKRDWSKE